MSSTGSVQTDQLFKGLTRPAMLWGVTYPVAILNLMISLLAFMYTNQFKMLFIVAPIIHLLGYLASSREPLFMELFFMKTGKCSKCKNKMYHGSNSYDVV